MIVDAHCHILPETFPARYRELAERDATFASLFPRPGGKMATVEDLLADMEAAGINRSLAMGFGWSDPGLAREVNDYLIRAVNRFPERLSGFCSVNPAWGQAALDEVERCAAAGLVGIGELHPDSQGFDLTDRGEMAPMMELAGRLRLPVLIHASEPVGHQYPGKGRTTPDKVYRFIRNFPDNVIICAHWGGGLLFYALMPELPGELGNVYFDTAASPFLYRKEVFSIADQTIGADKILFATDYPLLSHQRLIRQVEDSGLPVEGRAAILGGNAARLLGLPATVEERG